MSPLNKTLLIGVFFLMIFVTGLWVRAGGRPISGLRLNIHKFIALGVLVFAALTINQLRQGLTLSPLALALIIAAAFFFISTIVGGGLVSLEKPPHIALAIYHWVGPVLTALSTLGALALLLRLT